MSATEQEHTHGPGCGHTAVEHDGHTDYLQDGRLQHAGGNYLDAHVIAVGDENPDGHTAVPGGHDAPHEHGPGCGHEAVPHGDHSDYLVHGRLHHQHGDHCDDHGALRVL
jgi:hypothetical protein